MSIFKCLICYEEHWDWSGIPKSSTEPDDGTFENLRVIFVLRHLLRIPSSLCEKYLREAGNPSGWISTCSRCSLLVKEAFFVNSQMKELGQKLNAISGKVREDVKESLRRTSTSSACGLLKNITEEIREFVSNPETEGLYQDDSAYQALSIANITTIKEELDVDDVKSEFMFEEDFGDIGIVPEAILGYHDEDDQSSTSQSLQPKKPAKQKAPRQRHRKKPSRTTGGGGHSKIYSIKQIDKDNLISKQDLNIDSNDIVNVNSGPNELNEDSIRRSNRISRKPLKISSLAEMENGSDNGDGSDEWLPEYESPVVIPRKIVKNKSNRTKQESVSAENPEIKTFQCEECSETFKTDQILKTHLLKKHKITRRYKCTVCSHVSKESNHFRIHMQTHSGDRPYLCEICSKTFTHMTYLRWHKVREHSDKSKPHPFGCDKCSQVCSSVYSLRNHILTIHEKKFKSICDVCGAGFQAPNHLIVHMRGHNNERPCKCTYEGCSASYTQTHSLKAHIRRHHTKELPYKCSYCDRKFVDWNGLRNHEAVHSGNRPFKCKLCDKTFAISKYLRSHMQSHKKQTSKTKSTKDGHSGIQISDMDASNQPLVSTLESLESESQFPSELSAVRVHPDLVSQESSEINPYMIAML